MAVNVEPVAPEVHSVLIVGKTLSFSLVGSGIKFDPRKTDGAAHNTCLRTHFRQLQTLAGLH